MAEVKTTKKTAATRRPARAKAPQDRQPKQTAAPDHVTVRVRGADWTVDAEAMDDFELLDDLNALDQREDATRLPSVLRRLLGDEQWAKAMDTLRDKDSRRVSVEAGSGFVMELIEGLNPNSSSS